MENFEFYLGEDVLQGEEEIPFYLLWKNQDIDNISISFSGFVKIARLFNVNTDEIITEIPSSLIKVDGYLGGTLVPRITNDPYLMADLCITIFFKDGSSQVFEAKRIIHTTRVDTLLAPEQIKLPSKQPICLNLKGNSTIMIEIAECDESEIKLDYPSDIRSALTQFNDVFSNGMMDLKDKYPAHSELIGIFISPPEKVSFSEFKDRLEILVKKAAEDQSFTDALISTWASIVAIQISAGNPLFYATLEYFESRSGSKAFIINPLLCIDVPKGGGHLCFELIIKDILGNQCGEPVKVKTMITSNNPVLVPIKDLIIIERKLEVI